MGGIAFNNKLIWSINKDSLTLFNVLGWIAGIIYELD